MLILSNDAASAIRPGEMKAFRIDEAASLAPSEEDKVKGNEDSTRKSFGLTSKVRTLSSPTAKQLTTALEPRRPILRRYCRADWLWA